MARFGGLYQRDGGVHNNRTMLGLIVALPNQSEMGYFILV